MEYSAWNLAGVGLFILKTFPGRIWWLSLHLYLRRFPDGKIYWSWWLFNSYHLTKWSKIKLFQKCNQLKDSGVHAWHMLGFRYVCTLVPFYQLFILSYIYTYWDVLLNMPVGGLPMQNCLLVWMCMDKVSCDGLAPHPECIPALCPAFPRLASAPSWPGTGLMKINEWWMNESQ